MSNKISVVDIAVNIVLAVMAAAAAVLLCIYLFSGNSMQDDTPSEIVSPHIIGGEETQVSSETAVTLKTESVTETETYAGEEKIPVAEYDPAFFEKAFFIGDSLSVGFINYEFLKPENVFAQVGITPSSVSKTKIDDVSVYEKLAAFDPEYICILLGTNGLSYLKADFMYEKMGVFIDEIKQLCPNAEIVLVSIPPVTQKHEEEKPEKLDAVIEYNEHLRKLATEKSVAFADAFTFLQDDTGYLASDYAEHDGLHLKIHAYPVILGVIQTAFIDYYGEKPISSETSVPDVTETSDKSLTVSEQSEESSETTASTTVNNSDTSQVFPEISEQQGISVTFSPDVSETDGTVTSAPSVTEESSGSITETAVVNSIEIITE